MIVRSLQAKYLKRLSFIKISKCNAKKIMKNVQSKKKMIGGQII